MVRLFIDEARSTLRLTHRNTVRPRLTQRATSAAQPNVPFSGRFRSVSRAAPYHRPLQLLARRHSRPEMYASPSRKAIKGIPLLMK